MTNAVTYFATCPKGLESLLLQELRSLGAHNARETVAGVSFSGPLALGYRCCLWSRLANKVLMPLVTTGCHSADELYQRVKAIDWHKHLAVDGTFCIDFSGRLNDIKHSHFGALKAKDAIADYFFAHAGRRPDVDGARPDLRVNVRVHKGNVTVAIDLSGDSLHKRGYRQQGGAAPLKENLAAAMLLRADWPGIAAKGGALVDPLCGSGTLLIEAALMAADIAPGLNRQYWGFDHWQGHQPDVWHALVNEAQTLRNNAMNRQWPLICGYDNSPVAVKMARDNIARAALADNVSVMQKPLAQLTNPVRGSTHTGLLITNPPYGARLGDEAALVPLYRTLGERLKQDFVGWRAGMLTGNGGLGKKMALRSHKQYQLFNGAIACKLLLFDIQATDTQTSQLMQSSATGGVEHTHKPAVQPLSSGAQMFANRLRKNYKKLEKWLRQHTIHAYRLYDADMPEYNVVIDCYNDWVHVAEYAPPAKVDAGAAAQRLQDVLSAIPVALSVAAERIVLKQRRRQKGESQYERERQLGEFFQVAEGRARLWVNLKDYLDTGLFLDHRPLRLYMAQASQGKRVLNLFCYTAAISVHAALGGAVLSDSVDLSRTYLDWGRRNMVLNGLNDTQHRLIRADVRQWLEQAKQQYNQQYDVIVLDPPTFSNSRKMDGVLDIQRDHVQLIHKAIALLAPGGVLIFSTNQRQFVLDKQALAAFCVEDKTHWSIDKDFLRSQKIHQCWFITRP